MHEARYSRMRITTMKGTTRGTFWVDIVWIYAISNARGFLSIKYFPSVTLKTLASSCSKMYRELMTWRTWIVPVQTEMGWVWPLFLLNKHSDLSFYYIYLRKVKKNCSITFFFWGVTSTFNSGVVMKRENIMLVTLGCRQVDDRNEYGF